MSDRLCPDPDCEGSSPVGAARREPDDPFCPVCHSLLEKGDVQPLPRILRELIEGIAETGDDVVLIEITSSRQGEHVLFSVVGENGSLLATSIGSGPEAVDAEAAIARLNAADG